VSFQVETQVLRGADAVADRIAAFGLALFAAVDGRPMPDLGARKRRRKVVGKTAKGSGASKRAASAKPRAGTARPPAPRAAAAPGSPASSVSAPATEVAMPAGSGSVSG
jgi:hypothetical protein